MKTGLVLVIPTTTTMLSNREDHFFIGVEKSTKFQSWMTVVSSTEDIVELTLMMGDVGGRPSTRSRTRI